MTEPEQPDPAVPPAEPTAVTPGAAMPPAAPAPRRRALPWVLLAIGGAALLVAGVIVALVVIPSFVGGGTDPAQTVRQLDRAYREVDCELYQATTTEQFRATGPGADDSGRFTCADWEEFAAGYTVGGEYQYRVEVIESEVAGDEATVLTHEVDLATDEEFDYDYSLVQGVDGQWVISSILSTESDPE